MHYTVYRTPIVRHFFIGLARLGLWLTGWKLVGTPPEEKKYVLIAVPHSSNWDFPISLAMAFILEFELCWMGKKSLFIGPLGPIMRWLGGISIDRSKANNVVQSTIDTFNEAERLVLMIPPEGTRSKVAKWKTGFYHIAYGAGVPISRGFLDYDRKIGGIGKTFYPTGDIEKDLPEIQSYYAEIVSRNE